MTVRVKLHAILRKFLPPGSEDNTAVLEVPDGSRVSDVIARLGWKKVSAGETVSPEALEANYIRRSDAEIFARSSF